MQQATRNKQHTTSNIQQATSNKQHTTSNMQQVTSNRQQAISNMQQATRNKQYATCNMQHATSHKPQATCNTAIRQNCRAVNVPLLSPRLHQQHMGATVAPYPAAQHGVGTRNPRSHCSSGSSAPSTGIGWAALQVNTHVPLETRAVHPSPAP